MFQTRLKKKPHIRLFAGRELIKLRWEESWFCSSGGEALALSLRSPMSKKKLKERYWFSIKPFGLLFHSFRRLFSPPPPPSSASCARFPSSLTIPHQILSHHTIQVEWWKVCLTVADVRWWRGMPFMIVVKPKKKEKKKVAVGAKVGVRPGCGKPRISHWFWKGSLESLDSHSYLQGGSLMGFHLAGGIARGSPQKICSPVVRARLAPPRTWMWR